MSNKPSIPQGTRDFGPEVVRKRQYIFNTIRSVFELYGFQPLETPAMENLETLMGKYGEEGDKLIFKILNNGLNDPKNQEKSRAGFEKVMEGKNSKDLTERALKYDLTIPFARYVAMNHGQLTFPFKRYQIQPVWRADRPQRGRYREFYQCDADVVGSKSLLNEVELVNIYNEVFTQLGLSGYELRINSRKILAALAEFCGGAEKMIDITIAIDKLDKIGLDKVKEELTQRGLNDEQISTIEKYLLINGSNEEKLNQIEQLLGHLEIGKLGIEELKYVVGNSQLTTDHADSRQPDKVGNSPLILDFTLARGLNYYTGIIFEAKGPATVKMGSIGGGGRYDDLTGLFGVPNIPGVGISFGVDRICDVLEELNLFPEDVYTGTQVLFFNMGAQESARAFNAMQLLRKQGVRCELYHESAKMDKQFKYAEKKNIGFIVIIGSTEIQNNTGVVKNLKTGTQQTVALADLNNKLFI
ncbi:histidine--tRNA ligase [Niastella yeongjuensis]|uniref:Histidine--tRNA ligase n=1 Tax=Niastella yeongjuensis TaxID=354355 RepID=A0A1V9EYP5_9BACT|nr:histidine--tRNA ligase [Niastella yeongjuensis]OQP51074.1 histidine--tRNA ligase [Niastella yeongjuensis]SEN04014.1 histidyl-tRNA synthetase [Niastella yeongjuensis]